VERYKSGATANILTASKLFSCSEVQKVWSWFRFHW